MTSSGLPLRGKVILYRACVRNVIIMRDNKWPVKKDHMIRLKKNDGTMVRKMWDIRQD